MLNLSSAISAHFAVGDSFLRLYSVVYCVSVSVNQLHLNFINV
jgi:hypothetical protein